ncbi:hypothetical protein SMICM17S_04866 [Streptomyces microflavus]
MEAIRPSDHWEMVSLSIRGHFWSQPSAYASEESRKRLCSPVLFDAQIVLWVYPPDPDTSSRFWCGCPHCTLRLCLRDSGATYASMPMIGVTPALVAEWKKS